MGYAILWFGLLGSVLLLQAFLITVASHSDSRFVRRGLPYAYGILYIPIAATALVTGVMSVQGLGPGWPFWYMLSLALACPVGIYFIARSGKKLPAAVREPADPSQASGIGVIKKPVKEAMACHWPRLQLGAVFLVVLIATVGTYFYLDNKVLEELAQLRAETTAQLQQMMPRIADAQNARLLYEKASRSLGAAKDLPKWLRQKPADIPSQEVASFVGAKKETLDLLHQAASLSSWGQDMDPVKPAYAWPIPDMSSYMSLADLLYHSAVVKTDAGDGSGALKDLSVIESMSNHLRMGSSLMSAILSITLDKKRVQGLEYLLSHLPDRTPMQISPVKAHGTALDMAQRALRSENLVMSDGLYYAVVKGWDDAPPCVLSLYRVFFAGSDIRATIAERDIIARQARTYEELDRNNLEALEALRKGKGLLTTLLEVRTSYTSYIYRAMDFEANQGLADLAMAMTAYKSANGSYPDSFELLVPDFIDRVPVDPFDGKPLKMKPVQGGLELFSISSHPEIKPSRGTHGPINFYLGREAFEELRVKPEREKRLQEEKKKQ